MLAVWPFLVSQAELIHNSLASRSSTAILPGRSPYEMVTGNIPNLSVLRVPLCRMEATVRSQRDLTRIGKLAPRTTTCVHLCWDQKRKGYMAYAIDLMRLTTFRASECEFFETEFPKFTSITGHYVVDGNLAPLPTAAEQQVPAESQRTAAQEELRRQMMNRPQVDIPENELEDRDAIPDADPAAAGPPSRRLRSSGHSPDPTGLAAWSEEDMLPLANYVGAGTLCINVMAATTECPASWKECMLTPEKDDWIAALNTHMEGKMANGTCTFVPKPPGVKTVSSKLVPGLKFNDDNSIRERTIRWVARGFSQVEGVNYNETFTATTKACAMRAFLVLIFVLGLLTRKADVPKAFTRATLDCTIYVEQPVPGILCRKRDKHGNYFVCLLHKALEGLKQAGHLFQKLNSSTLLKLGFKQMTNEPTVFIKHTAEGLIACLVWIDDFAIGYSSPKMLKDFFSQYKAVEGLDIKDEGPLRVLCGMELDFKPDSLIISQHNQIERSVLKYFPSATGLARTLVPSVYNTTDRTSSFDKCALRKEDEKEISDGVPYLSMVALVLYFACMTCPQLAFSAAFLGRFMSDPNEACIVSATMLVACLYHNRTDRLVYTKGASIPKPISDAGYAESVRSNYGIYVSSDASWKIKSSNEMNMTYAGHIIFMCGAALDWSAKLLRVLCWSSAEAEIGAGSFAGKRAQFMRHFTNEAKELGFGVGVKGPFVYLIDNKACGPLTANEGVSKKTEHFLRWQHYLRWLVYHRLAVVIWISTKEMTADMMTKSIDQTTYLKHKRTSLGVTV